MSATNVPLLRTPVASCGGNQVIVEGTDSGFGTVVGWYDVLMDAWLPIPPAPLVKGNFSAVWTGNGLGPTIGRQGAVFHPLTGAWSSISFTGAPPLRKYFSMHWTGSEALVWEGCVPLYGSTDFPTGGLYSP